MIFKSRKASIKEYDLVIKYNPNDKDAYLAKSVALLSLGKQEESRDCLKKVNELANAEAKENSK